MKSVTYICGAGLLALAALEQVCQDVVLLVKHVDLLQIHLVTATSRVAKQHCVQVPSCLIDGLEEIPLELLLE